MMIEKHSDAWYAALDDYIASKQAQPFAWADHDCCTFAAGWVQIATGHDPMHGLRDLRSARPALRKLATLGGLLAAVDGLLGQHLPGAFAQAGDVAMVTLGKNRAAMAVCNGTALVVPGVRWLEVLPMTEAVCSWRV